MKRMKEEMKIFCPAFIGRDKRNIITVYIMM
jgi:hypothetical protein